MPFRLPIRLPISLAQLAVALSLASSAQAAIQFDDVSIPAGMTASAATAASAWGDLDGDGWPDLWVSNHQDTPPSLYLNMRNGTFADVADSRIADAQAWLAAGPGAVPVPDFHGGAWADFDRDGDEDLLAVTGAGAGRGESANHLFVNDSGLLGNAAPRMGLDYPLGRGRTPLWLDANGDGMLDALLMNKFRATAPSAIFLQEAGGFVESNRPLRFGDAGKDPDEDALTRVWGWFLSWFDGSAEGTADALPVDDEFAQLADIDGDAVPELVAYGHPTRIYGLAGGRLEAKAGVIQLPKLTAVQDALFEDFDGDARLDWFLIRSRPWASDVVQTDARRLAGRLGGTAVKPAGFSFRSAGTVAFHLYRPWMDPSDPEHDRWPSVYLGSRRVQLSTDALVLNPADPSLTAAPPLGADAERHVSISYDPAAAGWTLSNSLASLGLIIIAEQPIDRLSSRGFEPSQDALPDAMLFNRGGMFEREPDAIPGEATPCVSGAAADFDNDMDVDLYLACTHPAGNAPNLLYLNDGHGRFSVVPGAGGAAGSMRGRSNQVSTADFDRDGFVDLFVTNGLGPPPFADGPHQLFRNQGNANHWLEIDLHGTASNPHGLGATVYVDAGGSRQVRHQGGGIHSFSQNHRRLHFGLGPHARVQTVTIHWPSGAVQSLRDIAGNQVIAIVEGK